MSSIGKSKEIIGSLRKPFAPDKGKRVFYASKKAGEETVRSKRKPQPVPSEENAKKAVSDFWNKQETE